MRRWPAKARGTAHGSDEYPFLRGHHMVKPIDIAGLDAALRSLT